MGEIDTTSIESVQASLFLFGEKFDQSGNGPSCCTNESAKETEIEALVKDLASYKFQLEAKDSAYKQALMKLERCQKIAQELSTLLMNSEFEKDIFFNECMEGRMRIGELESKLKDLADQQSETIKIRKQLAHALNELRAAQAEMLSKETEIAAVKIDALTQEELMGTELQMEKEKTKGLLRHVSELSKAVLHLRMASIEEESEKNAIQSEEELECMRKELRVTQELESQIMNKSKIIESLQEELLKVNELHSLSEKAVSGSASELNQLRSDLELHERKNLAQLGYIEALEMELDRFKQAIKNAKEEAQPVDSDAVSARSELKKVKAEMEEIREKETEAEVEIVMLKSELQIGRSRIAAAEAAETRAKSEKSGLYRTVQQPALEAEDAEKETQRLKEEEARKIAENSEKPMIEKFSQDEEIPQIAESETEGQDRQNDNNTHVLILKEKYKALIEKAKKVDQIPEPVLENVDEVEMLKKELEIATVKIREFRTRAEQAMSRAEVAEKAKRALEDKIRKEKERSERRKAAIAALREESFSVREEYSSPKESSSYRQDQSPSPKPLYQPLSKILKMKF